MSCVILTSDSFISCSVLNVGLGAEMESFTCWSANAGRRKVGKREGFGKGWDRLVGSEVNILLSWHLIICIWPHDDHIVVRCRDRGVVCLGGF